MSIVLFIIGLNITLALGLFWIAGQILKWRRSLKGLTRSLQVAEQTVQQHLSASPSTPLPIVAHYQHLESQLTPRLKSSAQALAGLQRVHRLWRVTIKKRRGF